MTETTKKSRVVRGKVPEEAIDILLNFERIKLRGDVLRIANELGYTVPYVSMCINGHYPNESILDKICEIADERKAKWAHQLKRVQR